MEEFPIIVNGFEPLTITTKRSILAVATVLDPPLLLVLFSPWQKSENWIYVKIEDLSVLTPPKTGRLELFLEYTVSHFHKF